MRKGLSLAAVGILIGIATIALAVPSNEILRVEFNQTFTGECGGRTGGRHLEHRLQDGRSA
jgi:hypothetical protein